MSNSQKGQLPITVKGKSGELCDDWGHLINNGVYIIVVDNAPAMYSRIKREGKFNISLSHMFSGGSRVKRIVSYNEPLILERVRFNKKEKENVTSHT